MYETYQTKRFKKQFRKLDKSIKQKVESEINKLKKSPSNGEQLKGNLIDFYRVRIDNYRLVYRFHESPNRLELIYIGLRKNVYEELERLRKEEVL